MSFDKRLFILALMMCLTAFTAVRAYSQCLDDLDGVVWHSKRNGITIEDVARFTAPMLWFSPDEPNLLDANGKITLPQNLPFDDSGERPIVYYKVRSIYANTEKSNMLAKVPLSRPLQLINLVFVRAIDVEFYFYYESESGLGGHPHDLESVALQLQVLSGEACEDFNYAIQVKKVIARAHGLTWFENSFHVDEQTHFPLSILIEEGKHANCTDKNADGIYTPSYDVTLKVNDAWGVRDIIRSGNLFSGGYQAWMTKVRDEESLLLPPLPESSPFFDQFSNEYAEQSNVYELRAFPDEHIPIEDKKLRKMVKSKKPHTWPRLIKVGGDGSILQWSKENKPHKSVGFNYRHDESGALAFTIPLLIVRNVPAPMTGGWFFHKIYLGSEPNVVAGKTRLLGHQITHTNSASRWIDSYVGLGYELLDINPNPDIVDGKGYFVSEIGLKIRANITHSPFKFLRHLGTEYWGVKVGWKNIGFNPFLSSGFVIEIGAGVF